MQYADYAAQERPWLQGEVLEKKLAFWRERLKGPPAVIKLPLDRPRPDGRTYAGTYEPILISAEDLRPFKALGRGGGRHTLHDVDVGLPDDAVKVWR